MDGRNTIIITLQCYFHASQYRIARFNPICDLLLSGLIDGNNIRIPAFEDLEAEIDAVALAFLPDTQYDLTVIQNDLWTILVNWLDTVKWARKGAQAFMEKQDLLADLAAPIVYDIMNDPHYAILRQYYQPNILHALIQQSAPTGYIITPYSGRPLPQNIDLDTILQYYEQLSYQYGFDDDVHLLLQILFDKMMRNENRHAEYIVEKYLQKCDDSQTQPSFYDYIADRKLNISPEFLIHCQHLFDELFQI